MTVVLVATMAEGAQVMEVNKIGHEEGGGPALQEYDHFGWSVALVGDVTGNGRPHIVVGSPNFDSSAGFDTGMVYLLSLASNGDATVVNKIGHEEGGGPTLQSGDYFGSSVALVGDVTGNDRPHIAVGAYRVDSSTGSDTGAVYLLSLASNGDATVVNKIGHEEGGGPTLQSGDYFGSAVALVGDVTGNGRPHIVVGAHDVDSSAARETGAVYLLSLASDGDATVVNKIGHEEGGGPTLQNFDNFGSSVANVGDVTGNGRPHIAVGASGVDRNTAVYDTGAMYLLSLASNGEATVVNKIGHEEGGGPTLQFFDYFGSSVALVGDVTGNGRPHIAVGAMGVDVRGSWDTATGAVYLLSLASNGEATVVSKIGHNEGGGPTLHGSSYFGSSVALVGDVTGDGQPHIAVGAAFDTTYGSSAGPETGAEYLLRFLPSPTPSPTPSITPTPSPTPTPSTSPSPSTLPPAIVEVPSAFASAFVFGGTAVFVIVAIPLLRSCFSSPRNQQQHPTLPKATSSHHPNRSHSSLEPSPVPMPSDSLTALDPNDLFKKLKLCGTNSPTNQIQLAQAAYHRVSAEPGLRDQAIQVVPTVLLLHNTTLAGFGVRYILHPDTVYVLLQTIQTACTTTTSQQQQAVDPIAFTSKDLDAVAKALHATWRGASDPSMRVECLNTLASVASVAHIGCPSFDDQCFGITYVIDDANVQVSDAAIVAAGMCASSAAVSPGTMRSLLFGLEATMMSSNDPHTRMVAAKSIAVALSAKDRLSPQHQARLSKSLDKVQKQDIQTVADAAKLGSDQLDARAVYTTCGDAVVKFAGPIVSVSLAYFNILSDIAFVIELGLIAWNEYVDGPASTSGEGQGLRDFWYRAFAVILIVALSTSLGVNFWIIYKARHWKDDQTRSNHYNTTPELSSSATPSTPNVDEDALARAIEAEASNRRGAIPTHSARAGTDCGRLLVFLACIGSPELVLQDTVGTWLMNRPLDQGAAVFVRSTSWLSGVLDDLPQLVIQITIAVATEGGLGPLGTLSAVFTAFDIGLRVARNVVASAILTRFSIRDIHLKEGVRAVIERRPDSDPGLSGSGVIDGHAEDLEWFWSIWRFDAWTASLLLGQSVLLGSLRLWLVYVGVALVDVGTGNANVSAFVGADTAEEAAVVSGWFVLVFVGVVVVIRGALSLRILSNAPMPAHAAGELLSHGMIAGMATLLSLLGSTQTLRLLWPMSSRTANVIFGSEAMWDMVSILGLVVVFGVVMDEIGVVEPVLVVSLVLVLVHLGYLLVMCFLSAIDFESVRWERIVSVALLSDFFEEDMKGKRSVEVESTGAISTSSSSVSSETRKKAQDIDEHDEEGADLREPTIA